MGNGADTAWRVTMVVPGFVCVLVATLIMYTSDDWPTAGVPADVPVTRPKLKSVTLKQMGGVVLRFDVIIMMVMYSACFGVELAVNNALGIYYYDNFKKDDCDPLTDENECRVMNQTTSGQIASIFGLMNLFARALGGVLSDRLSKFMLLHGRLVAQFVCLLCEGLMLVAFGSVSDLEMGVVVLLFFSVFTQGSEGTTFALVPFIDVHNIGAVAGLVGAGGNIGAVMWSSTFKAYTDDPRKGFRIVGFVVIAVSFLTMMLHVQGQNLLRLVTGNQGLSKVVPEVEISSRVSLDHELPPARKGCKLASDNIVTAMYPHSRLQDGARDFLDSGSLATAMYPIRGWISRRENEHEIVSVSSWR